MNEQIFKVGDRVWCCNHGWGNVTDITNYKPFPIKVTLDKGENVFYGAKGEYLENGLRTLFFKKQKFDESRPEPEYEIGAWYWADIIGDKLPIKYLGEYHWRVNGVINRLDPKVICKIEEP